MEYRVHTASFLSLLVTRACGSLVTAERVLSAVLGRRRNAILQSLLLAFFLLRFHENFSPNGVRPWMREFSGNTGTEV